MLRLNSIYGHTQSSIRVLGNNLTLVSVGQKPHDLKKYTPVADDILFRKTACRFQLIPEAELYDGRSPTQLGLANSLPRIRRRRQGRLWPLSTARTRLEKLIVRYEAVL